MTEKVDKQKPQVRPAVYTNTVEATPWSIKLDTADPDIYNQKQSEIDKEFIAKNYKQSGESGLTDNLDSTLDNFGFIVKDLLAGDPKALERPEITCLNFDAIKAALQWLNEQNEFDNTMKADLFSNAWRLNFKCRPPTPEEFLTEKYIGPMAESLRPSLRDTFCEAFDPLKPYRTIVLTPHIGWGKAQPYSSKIAVDEESVIDFTFDDGQVLTFNEEDCTFKNFENKKYKITKRKRLVYKSIGEIKIGDQVISPGDNKLHPKVISIQEQGISDVYKITLNSGKSFRTHKDHLTTVCFRQKNGKPVWDTLRTEWMMNNLDKYHFVVLSNYDELKWPDIVSSMLEHENEPDDEIIPLEIEGDFIISIEKVGKENCRCITLSNPEGLYFTDNGIITHNSTWSVLANLFVSTHFAMMWHPYKYFNLAVSTMFTQVLGAWNLKKASELLMEPFMQILEASPYFKRVRTHTDLLDANGADLVDSLHYTTSAPTSVLQFQNGVNYKIINGPGAILGQTIIMGVISELTTFVDEGWSEEKILKFFTKLRKRIDSRMNGNYYGRFILDSQPNTLESCIDAWIWSDDTRKNSENYIVSGSRWKFMPEEFTAAWETPRTDWKDPINLKKDFVNSFPIFKGGNGVVPQVIESPAQLEQFDQHDVIWAPTLQVTSQGIKNYKEAALESPIEFLRDWAGIPSGAADRLFYDPNVVEDIFDNSLKNCFGGLDVPASEEPEHLIWNKVKDKFFNKIMDKYYFYYEPQIPRVASVDLAITGDVASISVSHVERSKDKKDSEGNPAKIYVTDFSIPVVPKNSIINMDAFKFFLIDLRQLGNMNIKYVSFDGFQSRSIMQSLQRHGFDVSLLSVDKETTPYQNMIDYAFHRRWVCGKSIMMKNNLLSLETTTRKQTGSKKIDHKKGENLYADDFCPINGLYNDMAWQHSQVGYYAKDLADTVCANIALIDEHDNEFLPIKVWEPMKATERTYEAVKANNNALLEKLGLRI